MTVSILTAIFAPSGDASDHARDAAAQARAAAERERDDALAARVRAGDVRDAEAAFEALFGVYVDSLVRFATSYTRDGEVAREIVSDVFLNVWERRATFAPEHGVGAYLFGAVRNRAHNVERARRRRETVASVAAREPELPGLGTASGAAERERDEEHDLLVERVRAALAALPTARREAMVLRWEHQMMPEQIADVMGITRTAVYHLLDRARKTLRELLGPDLR